MNANAADVAAWVGLGIVIATAIHAAVVAAVVNLRSNEPPVGEGRSDDEQPFITWFRPLKSGVTGLPEKLRTFLGSIRAGDQVLLGIDPNSPDRAVCEALRADFPEQVEVVCCSAGVALNPKMSKLIQMSPRARHDHWIVADAEACLDSRFTNAFRTEWTASSAEIFTAGYRMAGTDSVPQRLDALSVLMTLWPGLELVRMFSRLRFTLGACTAFQRATVEKMGGWAAFADQLAEDYEFGRRFTESGGSVGFSRAILTLDADPMTWLDYWRHQVRVAVTYRAATPAGAAGMIATRGVTAAFLLLVFHPGMAALIFLLLAGAIRLALGVRMGRRVAWPVPGLAWMIPVADAVETAAWVVSWFARRVWWGGGWRRVTWRGRLVAEGEAGDRAPIAAT